MTINLLPSSSPLLPALKTPHVAIVAPRIIKHHITSVFFSTFSELLSSDVSVICHYFFLSIFEYLSLPALKTPHVAIVAPRIIKHHCATIGIKLKSIFVNQTEKMFDVHRYKYQDNTNTNTINCCPSHN